MLSLLSAIKSVIRIFLQPETFHLCKLSFSEFVLKFVIKEFDMFDQIENDQYAI